LLVIENVTKQYRGRRGIVAALDGISMEVGQGEFVVLRGPSGSGKTTLLLAAGGMLAPTGGRILMEGKSLYDLSLHERSRFRAVSIGFVFQMFHLVPYLNVLENVLLHGGAPENRLNRQSAAELLERLGLGARITHKPSELSAGERQRTAIARALLKNPTMVLADEPTGNLDTDNAHAVFGYLAEYRKAGGTIILATHGGEAEAYADRLVVLREGRIVTA
jgi:ABC-type lipoprotein export system ATPase subunit